MVFIAGLSCPGSAAGAAGPSFSGFPALAPGVAGVMVPAGVGRAAGVSGSIARLLGPAGPVCTGAAGPGAVVAWESASSKPSGTVPGGATGLLRPTREWTAGVWLDVVGAVAEDCMAGSPQKAGQQSNGYSWPVAALTRHPVPVRSCRAGWLGPAGAAGFCGGRWPQGLARFLPCPQRPPPGPAERRPKGALQCRCLAP